jgi:hypothetical protein
MQRRLLIWSLAVLCMVFVVVAAGFWKSTQRFSSTNSSRRNMTLLLADRIQAIPETTEQLHVMILVHGWMGNSAELSYLQSTLETTARKKFQTNNHHLLVYSSECNEGQTSDGIEKGGARLANEINSILNNLKSTAQPQNRKISLSLVGNSLGGLYARYALSQLDWNGVTPAIFCTTATPHLGCSNNTYISIPRMAEWAIAHALQPTGRDLFLYTPVLANMVLDAKFVRPLESFQKRLAYANAHATDFQVPAATAAFLAPMDSKHVRYTVHESPFLSLAVQTPVRKYQLMAAADDITLVEMARRLDAMGWHKVFLDLRSTLPSLPFFGGAASTSQSSTLDDDKTEYTSLELLEKLGSLSDRIHFPAGHTMLIANSKNEAYAQLNAGGQPVMDQLAADLVDDLAQSCDVTT